MKKITLFMLIAFTTITVQAQNKLLSSIREYNNNGSWEKSSGTNYEYDTNNNLIAETNLNWNGATSVWESNGKTTYTYNASNKVTQELYVYQELNLETNQLETFSGRDIYTYTNGRLTGIESQELTGSNWDFYDKVVIFYNSSNLPESAQGYSWDGTQWVNADRTTVTYNSNNKISTDTYEEWKNSQWVNDSKTIYSYNSNDQLITERSATWDEFNNIWVEAGANRTDYELDANGNRSSLTESGNYNYREEHSYDTSKLMSSFAHPFQDKSGIDYLFEDFPYVNKLLASNSFNYNSTTSSYTNSSRTTYNYNSSITLGTETLETADKSITVYPNPTSDFLSIQNESNALIEKITISDLTGKQVLEQKNTSRVNVQNLAKGMYVLEAFVGKNKETRKFIKD